MSIENLVPEDYPDFFAQGEPICSQVDPEAFFPQEKNGNRLSSYYDERGAKGLCSTCPYKIACLVYALKYDESGIWGGTTDGQRRLIKKDAKTRGVSFEEIAVEIP